VIGARADRARMKVMRKEEEEEKEKSALAHLIFQ
jgi:hypothetical protein